MLRCLNEATLLKIDLLVEQVEARGEVAIEEIGFGEAEIDLGALKASGEAKPDILAFAHQVALGDADVADDAFARGVTGTEGQLAGRLLYHLDHDDDPVGRAAGLGLDLDGLEKAERAQSLARRLDQQAVKGVAFGQAKLAPDDVVLGAEIADDVDALDIDPRALVDDVDDVHGGWSSGRGRSGA